MPDYPYVYATSAPRPVLPGGTRVRVLRRGAGREEAGDEGDEGARGEEDRSWQALLHGAVEELNASFRRAGAPFTCDLEEDEHGISLHVRRHGEDGRDREVEEETLEPRDLPLWLNRIRVGLGLLIDETA